MLVLFAPHVSAQPQQQIELDLTVTDTFGARVPGAHIRIECGIPSKTLTEAKTNPAGEAIVTVHPGDCAIIAGAPGFKFWRYQVDAQEKSRSITAVLRISEAGSGYPVNEVNIIQTNLQIVEAFIPQEELELLPGLPSHKLRSHHH